MKERHRTQGTGRKGKLKCWIKDSDSWGLRRMLARYVLMPILTIPDISAIESA
jgi:hypothetical protein